MELIYSTGGREKYFKAEHVGDCAVRAIAIALEKDYLQVYNDLKKLNKGKSCRNGTPKNVDKKYLLENGWHWVGVNRGKGETLNLCEQDFPKGTYIISVSKHLTVVKDGKLYDTYDCSRDGERTVYGYYVKDLNEKVTPHRKRFIL